MAQHHECDILCFGEEKDKLKAKEWEQMLPGLRVLGVCETRSGFILRLQQMLRLTSGIGIPSELRWQNSQFADAVREAIIKNHYDVVHLDVINMMQYGDLVKPLPTVLSTTDAHSLRMKRGADESKKLISKFMMNRLARVMAKAEKANYHKFNAVHVVSPVDLLYYENQANYDNLAQIPVAVDDDYFEIFPIDVSRAKRFTVFISGNFSEPHILTPVCDFMEKYWQKLLGQSPEARCIIIGKNAPNSMEKQFSKLRNVDFYGWVDNYIDFLAQADVALFLDTSGAGMKNRVMQALAAARPVIGTKFALEGISIENGVHCFEVDNPEDACLRLYELIDSSSMRNTMGLKARELAHSLYTKQVTGEAWEQLYKKVCSS